MKSLVLFVAFLPFASAHANPQSCAATALTLAENAYGNYIHETRTKVLVPNKQYLVTVGIGNYEDGAHTYRITFRDAYCKPSNVQICDTTQPGYGPSNDCK